MKGMTAKARIERAHVDIMRNPSFCAWAGLLMLGNWGFDERMPTAYVDAAGNVKYNTEFINSFSKENNIDVYVHWVILHENAHKALLHLTRGKKYFEQSPELANIAADFVVNLLLKEIDPNETFAKHPRNADGTMRYLYDEKYIGWSLKQVWEDLLHNKNPNFKVKQMDVHSTEGLEGKPLTEGQEKAVEQAVDQALRSGMQYASKFKGTTPRALSDMLTQTINWREQMDEFIMNVCQGDDYATWRRPNRRFIGYDMYIPSMQTENVGPVGVWLDTSGSVTGDQMTACVMEVVNMCRAVRPEKMILGYWSNGIERLEEYTPEQYDDIITVTKPTGGGGTEITEVAEYANKIENLQCSIILTDGYIADGWGAWDMPTLWAFTNRNHTAPMGRSLYVDLD